MINRIITSTAITRLRVFLGIPTSPLVLDRTQPALIGTRVLGLRLGLQSCDASVMQPAGRSLWSYPWGYVLNGSIPGPTPPRGDSQPAEY
jgi:hypothetical protein